MSVKGNLIGERLGSLIDVFMIGDGSFESENQGNREAKAIFDIKTNRFYPVNLASVVYLGELDCKISPEEKIARMKGN